MEELGLIFDLDGTLVDNMPYHLKAWEKFMAEMGRNLQGEELFKELYGKNEEVIVRLFGNQFSGAELLELSHRKERYYRELYRPHIKLMPGAKLLFDEAAANTVHMAIATASMKMNVDILVDALGIRNYFAAIITADDVVKSKPDPESFLKAAEGINRKPKNCVVFEDVQKGVISAANAGMQAFVLTTSHRPGEFNGCNNIRGFMPDFTGIGIQQLKDCIQIK